MKSLTAAVKKRITADWNGCLPSMGIYKPMHLLRRVGPILIGVLLERDLSGTTYRPTFHVHNLGRKFPVIALSLSQALRTDRNDAAEIIEVRSHEQRFQEAAARLSRQAPLPMAGPVTLEEFIEAAQEHLYRPGVHYEPELHEDLISVVSWADDTVRARKFFDEAKRLMGDWPTEVLEQLGSIQRWGESIASHGLVSEAVRQTAEEQALALRVEALPSDELVLVTRPSDHHREPS